MGVALFVYGTLLDDGLVELLTGRRFARAPAVLHGYRKEMLPAGYPRIVADPAGRVQGSLLLDVDAQALAALDRYEQEGVLYRRAPVTVESCGRRLPAVAYVGIV